MKFKRVGRSLELRSLKATSLYAKPAEDEGRALIRKSWRCLNCTLLGEHDGFSKIDTCENGPHGLSTGRSVGSSLRQSPLGRTFGSLLRMGSEARPLSFREAAEHSFLTAGYDSIFLICRETQKTLNKV